MGADEQEGGRLEQVTKAALVVVVALVSAEHLRHRWRRAYHYADRWWADVEHRERDEVLRTELRSIAGQLAPVIGSRIGRPRS